MARPRLSISASPQLSLQRQIQLALVAMALLILILAGGAVLGVQEINELTEDALGTDTRLLEISDDIALDTLQLRRFEKDIFLNIDDPEQVNQYFDDWQKTLDQLKADIKAFDELAERTNEERHFITDWTLQLSTYESGMDALRGRIERGELQTPQEANLAFNNSKEAIRKFTASAIATADEKFAEMFEHNNEAQAISNNLLSGLMFLSALMLAVAIGLSIIVPNRLARPVRQLQQAAAAIAAGDLNARAAVARRDELGTLAEHFNHMADTLRSKLDELRNSNEITAALQQAEAGQRQTLERAVGEYLGFVEQLGQGNLEARIASSYEGSLGQLGSGLNGMAENLERLRGEGMRMQQEALTSRQVMEEAVGEYLAFVEQIGSGNLAARIAIRHEGALGQLGTGLNAMATSLQILTSEILQAATDIGAAAAEIQAATTQQAASAAEQAAAIAQTSTTIEEVRVIAEQTAGQAEQVARDSQAVLDIARQGLSAVEQTVGGMGTIQEQVEQIAQTILVLAERAQAISGIVSTVAELADQSNLLALNAAIEAARAGEQGKSFAVVAQHVRDLAERSKGATQQVRGILNEIQQATSTAVMVTEEGSKGVENGVGRAGVAGDVIHRMATEVEGGTQMTIQIAAAAQQQTAGMEQIDKAMQSIKQATTQVLSSTRQAERAASDLHRLAKMLQQTVATYRV